MATNNMKYRIIGRTNAYIAQHDQLFKGKTRVVLESDLDYDTAREKILDFFNEDYHEVFMTWANVRSSRYADVTWTHKDGARGYEYDSRYFEMEEQKEEDEV